MHSAGVRRLGLLRKTFCALTLTQQGASDTQPTCSRSWGAVANQERVFVFMKFTLQWAEAGNKHCVEGIVGGTRYEEQTEARSKPGSREL